ncbi:MAG: translation elongation factor 4, partial [Patescibacteria group bacterium]
MTKIRNFCIIAHIDHGKSTLADRMLELTNTVQKREMKEQLLDQLDLERERGITIKLAPVRMLWSPIKAIKNYELRIKDNPSAIIHDSKLMIPDSEEYILNLIDTPGHVDFAYEVSRSLAAVEGAVLLVDATQGIEAQTLSVLYAAMDHDLEIIPVVNKIDLPAARPDEAADEIVKVLGCSRDDILYASGKTGEGVVDILDRIVERIPAPAGDSNAPTRALIFDSVYDPYRGVVAYVRIVDGKVEKEDSFHLMETKSQGHALEVGYFAPKFFPSSPLSSGEIGYIVTGFKDVSEARVGDTITLKEKVADSPLPGYKKVLPLVFSSIYCADGSDYPELKEAIEKLKLNDASLSYETERSEALGFGFRCGFLGLLHMDIVKERLEREHNLSLVVSSPTVRYEVVDFSGEVTEICRPSDFPILGSFREILEPTVKLEVFSPKEYVGDIMELVQRKRAEFDTMEYLDENRVILRYAVPLAEVIIDLYDQIKSVSRGYASMNYELANYCPAELDKVDILIAEEKVDALSFITHKSKTYSEGKRIVEKLKELIPRQNFEVKIQAAIGGKIIASERISPFKKDVIA